MTSKNKQKSCFISLVDDSIPQGGLQAWGGLGGGGGGGCCFEKCLAVKIMHVQNNLHLIGTLTGSINISPARMRDLRRCMCLHNNYTITHYVGTAIMIMGAVYFDVYQCRGPGFHNTST